MIFSRPAWFRQPRWLSVISNDLVDRPCHEARVETDCLGGSTSAVARGHHYRERTTGDSRPWEQADLPQVKEACLLPLHLELHHGDLLVDSPILLVSLGLSLQQKALLLLVGRIGASGQPSLRTRAEDP
jgi:hypothetical protein